MKRLKFTFFALLLLIVSIVSTLFIYNSTYSDTYNNNEIETIINRYIDYINSSKWDEYVELFNYDEDVKNALLLFLKDKNKQAKKEGIHTIKNLKLVSFKLSNDPEFISQGDYVYEVLLDMKVYKPSEFYMNGVTRHVFVFNMTSEGLKIETVYFKGLANKDIEENR